MGTNLKIDLTEGFVKNLEEALKKYHNYLVSDKLKEEEEQELYGKMLLTHQYLQGEIMHNQHQSENTDDKMQNLIIECGMFINIVNKLIK